MSNAKKSLRVIGSGYYSGNRSRKEISPQLCGTFRAAYLQALLFLEVMNIYDGIVVLFAMLREIC